MGAPGLSFRGSAPRSHVLSLVGEGGELGRAEATKERLLKVLCGGLTIGDLVHSVVVAKGGTVKDVNAPLLWGDDDNQRVKLYLTNSSHSPPPPLFSNKAFWLRNSPFSSTVASAPRNRIFSAQFEAPISDAVATHLFFSQRGFMSANVRACVCAQTPRSVVWLQNAETAALGHAPRQRA